MKKDSWEYEKKYGKEIPMKESEKSLEDLADEFILEHIEAFKELAK